MHRLSHTPHCSPHCLCRRSYEGADLWPLLASPADGVQLSFVKAERSTFRWGGKDEERIRQVRGPDEQVGCPGATLLCNLLVHEEQQSMDAETHQSACATGLQLGHPVHLLQGAGHWVHTDNPGENTLEKQGRGEWG